MLHSFWLRKRQSRSFCFSQGERFLGAGQIALADEQLALNEMCFGALGVRNQDLLHHNLRLFKFAALGCGIDFRNRWLGLRPRKTETKGHTDQHYFERETCHKLYSMARLQKQEARGLMWC